MAVTRPSFLGMPNLTAIANSPSVGGSEDTSNPVTNITNDEPSSVSRITKTDPSQTYWKIPFNVLTTPQYGVGGAAVINHNFPDANQDDYPGTGQYRFVFSYGAASLNYTTLTGYQRLAPSGISTSSNITGGVTNVDEDPASPDGLLITPTNPAVVWQALFDFPTPGSNPRTAAHMQSFIIKMKVVNATAFTRVGFQCLLFEAGGGPIGDLGDIRYVDADGYLVWSWDASVIASADGKDVQAALYCYPDAAGAYGQLDAICWDCERTVPTYDSGWLAVPRFTAAYSTGLSGGIDANPQESGPSKSFHYFIPTQIDNCTCVHVRVRAAGHPLNHWSPPVSIPTYAQLGCLPCGPLFQTTHGIRKGTLRHRVVTTQYAGSKASGSPYAADAFAWREADFDLDLTRAEKDLLMDRLDWRKGMASPVYIALEPNRTLAEQQFTAFWANVLSSGDAEPMDAYVSGDVAGRWVKSYSMKERL